MNKYYIIHQDFIHHITNLEQFVVEKFYEFYVLDCHAILPEDFKYVSTPLVCPKRLERYKVMLNPNNLEPREISPKEIPYPQDDDVVEEIIEEQIP